MPVTKRMGIGSRHPASTRYSRHGRHALLEADRGQQVKRPRTGVLAKRARTFVHDRPKPFALGFVEHWRVTRGARRYTHESCCARFVLSIRRAPRSGRGVGRQRWQTGSGILVTQRRRGSEGLSSGAVVACSTADQHTLGVSWSPLLPG
jgi:hypothetical protein